MDILTGHILTGLLFLEDGNQLVFSGKSKNSTQFPLFKGAINI